MKMSHSAFWGVWEAFLPRLGRFAEYVVGRGKCGCNGESVCFGGELSRGKCGWSGHVNHIFPRNAQGSERKLLFRGYNPPKYGQIDISKNKVIKFNQKPTLFNNYINGGFFVCDPKVLKFIENDTETWEDIIIKLTKIKKVGAYIHKGNWSGMDTLRDKEALNKLWDNNMAFWKVW